MTMPQPGKVAVVSGGGRGLGRAMALGSSRAGFRVAITAARDRAEIEAVAREAPPGQIPLLVANVTYEPSCAALVEEVQARFGAGGVAASRRGTRLPLHDSPGREVGAAPARRRRSDAGSGWSKSACQNARPTRHHACGGGSPPRAVNGGAERRGQALLASNQ